MAIPVDKLQSILVQSKIQIDNPPLYQVIQTLISHVQQSGEGTPSPPIFIGGGGGGGGGGVPPHAITHQFAGTDPLFITSLPGYPGGTSAFLRADGTFAIPISGGSVIYQSGRFTPTLGGDGGETGQSYQVNSREGRYVRINELVTVNIFTQFTAKGTITGNLVMKGLPFISSGGAGAFYAASIGYMTALSNLAPHPVKHGVIGYVLGGTDYIKLLTYDDYAAALGNPTEMVGSDVNDTTQCVVAATYTLVP